MENELREGGRIPDAVNDLTARRIRASENSDKSEPSFHEKKMKIGEVQNRDRM